MQRYRLMDRDIPQMTRNYRWAIDNGIVFNGLPATDDVCSINGVHIMFFIHKDTPKEVIAGAKAEAKSKRDVVSFSCMVVPKGFPNEPLP